MKRILSLLILLTMVLSGCSGREKTPYRYTDYSFFDTVTTILGYGESPEAFEEQAEKICAELQHYHRLFDIYHEYEGMNNLKTVNDHAGIGPVEVEKPIISLLEDARNDWILTDQTVNVCMGNLLSLWHQARKQAEADPSRAAIPSLEKRLAAQSHSNFDDLIIDSEAGTVFLADPEMQLDVGAIAKGWAAGQVSKNAPAGMLISVGGNVCATGPKPDGSPWTVGIQNPRGEGYLRTLELREGCVVTSGDYQRFFIADGKRYHHIIDPQSTLPGDYFQSVTVICQDSGLADALSTALFLLPRERGQQLLDTLDAEAIWVDSEGTVFLSSGFPK